MLGDPKRQNHPMLSYLIGLVFAALTLLVLAGVIHHLTFSPYGPQLLKSLKDKFFPEHVSPIMEEAKRLEDLETHRALSFRKLGVVHNVMKMPVYFQVLQTFGLLHDG